VDDILKTEFGLSQGLADTSKTTITVNENGEQKKKEVHRVQILDPAAGTGTFLVETIKQIHKKFEGQQGIWNDYVDTHLIPRLNGFELLMASYAMAHLKIDLLLKETGYTPKTNQRLRVFLTNSLEEPHSEVDTLFSNWLTTEAYEANKIKNETPVMCVIGNPPYSGISSNNGEWISKLIEDYKYVDGVHFNERKHWLNDDYVKFIRYGQHFIEKNGSGILAFINPHGFLDNPTFRGMRWNLLNTFDKIYTIDLHGNSKKKEKSPDGSIDENVFDIQQGVSINIFVKNGKKSHNVLGKIFHFDMYGKREIKYNQLTNGNLPKLGFNEIIPEKPNYYFVKKNLDGLERYDKGFNVQKLFPVNNVGFVTANDGLNVSMSREEHSEKINDLLTMEETLWRLKYKRPKDADSWKYKWAKEDAIKNFSNNLQLVSYRPFDNRYTLYTGKSGGLYARPIYNVMQHFLAGENIGLVAARQCVGDWKYIFCTKLINEFNLTGTAGRFGSGNTFPLYLYPNKDCKTDYLLINNTERTPNLNSEIVQQIAEKLGLNFTPEKEPTENTFAPIDILDYIYAVLHSPTYREKYKEFLKIDFPRVPYPKDASTFWSLVEKGGAIRALHLLESPLLDTFITTYPESGTNQVGKVRYDNGKVYINETQYFDKVPQIAWEFFIGGYQPAQKWLKDRKDRALTFEDILHYQKIIIALTETDSLMKEIDGLGIEW
jgi:predicted helicase